MPMPGPASVQTSAYLLREDKIMTMVLLGLQHVVMMPTFSMLCGANRRPRSCMTKVASTLMHMASSFLEVWWACK